MIAMPTLIPTAQWNALSLAIARGATDQVQHLVEDYGLDADAFLDESSCMPVLMDALLSNGFESETDRLPLLRFLLERGANPNICCRKGYNCLHIAVQQEKFIKALDLFLDYNADVNVPDADGANVVYWAIQGFLLRKEGTGEASGEGMEDTGREKTGEIGGEKPQEIVREGTRATGRAEHLRVLEKILLLGADLDQQTRYGMNAREWLGHAHQDVQDLVARWEAGTPVVHPVTTIQPRFPTHLQYPELAKKIWDEYAAGVDPSTAVSGELLRAVETLREEAQRNRNANYRKNNYKRMAVFIRNTLVKSGIFHKTDIESIKSGTHRLMHASHPYMEDDVYDELVDKICIFYTRKQTPVAHQAPA